MTWILIGLSWSTTAHKERKDIDYGKRDLDRVGFFFKEFLKIEEGILIHTISTLEVSTNLEWGN